MVLTEIRGDLFVAAPPDAALAHCVSADLRMGRGVAAEFRRRFGCVDELRRQGRGIGEVAHVRAPGGRLIACLVTKARYFDKPSYDSLRACLAGLRQLCQHEAVTRLAMPRIGCGLDRLDWRQVRPLIEEVFANAGVDITICSL